MSKHRRSGYPSGMTESPTDLVKEAERGNTARAPFLALTGVTLVVTVLVAVIVVIALIVYFASK